MNIYKSFSELSEGINKSIYEIDEAWSKWIGRGYMLIDEIEVMKHIRDNEIHFITFNSEDNDECKEYIMKYEKDEYNWKVYVDDIEKWQSCKVIDIVNKRLGISRATVICESGTQVNRVVKFVLDESEIKEDRCIYYMEKE